MATKVLATPGVYIEEKNAFPSSVVAVATAVPAFIGYTEMALRGKKSLRNIPTRVTSLPEYTQLFGGPPKTTFTIAEDPEKDYSLTVDEGTDYYLYKSIRLFFANGGGTCYIVSVGDYSGGVKASELNDEENLGGLSSLRKEQEPTMVVIPDAMLLGKNDCYSLQQAMVMHCGNDMKSRVALLDIHDGYKERTLDDEDVVNNFREGVGNNFLAFGAAYYPWVNTTIVQANELDYTNISNPEDLQAILNKEVDGQLTAGFIQEKRADMIREEIAKITVADADLVAVGQTLLAVSPIYKDVLQNMRMELNLLPPSAGMAGIISMVDNNVGVHKAPANVGMNNVVAPAVNLTSENQEDLNLPLNGKAINAIRSFVGKGVIVWGARTLDGNSQDWRYVSVRRTVIMIEQSIKIAAEAYVFEPNDANTWASIKSMIINFLTNQWKSGALVGGSADDAFSVDVGLGVTMTPVDILDGVMKITVKVAVSRPAEFIVITFQQQMQKS
jgi:phage tail sheath protein FI